MGRQASNAWRLSPDGDSSTGSAVLDRSETKASMTRTDDRLQAEVLRLGRLGERGKTGQIEGNNRQLRVLARIGAGKVEELITQTYIGDHEEMKLAVDSIAAVLQGLQMELARLTEASRELQLAPKVRDGISVFWPLRSARSSALAPISSKSPRRSGSASLGLGCD
jgi:hypothetical protein